MARTSKPSPPVREIRIGRVRAAIWENETQNGTRHNVTLSRLYKDGDDSPHRENSIRPAKPWRSAACANLA
jgi:hypothetical protein